MSDADLILLKADPDAGSPARLEAARQLAAEPDAPRRALAGLGVRASTPFSYPGAILPQTGGPPELEEGAWPEDEEFESSDPNVRIAAYDRLDEQERARWDAAFRQGVSEWLDATAAYAETGAADTDGAWHKQVLAQETVDGGRLLICVEADWWGVTSWFEVPLFLAPQVADAAGFREPSRLDVT